MFDYTNRLFTYTFIILVIKFISLSFFSVVGIRFQTQFLASSLNTTKIKLYFMSYYSRNCAKKYSWLKSSSLSLRYMIRRISFEKNKIKTNDNSKIERCFSNLLFSKTYSHGQINRYSTDSSSIKFRLFWSWVYKIVWNK